MAWLKAKKKKKSTSGEQPSRNISIVSQYEENSIGIIKSENREKASCGDWRHLWLWWQNRTIVKRMGMKKPAKQQYQQQQCAGAAKHRAT